MNPVEFAVANGLTREEYELAREKLGRDLTEVEIGMLSALWSEHCGYKNTKPLIRTLPTSGKYVVQGPGENAGVVKIDDVYVVFKIESHNHPSAVEPYQGAATGVGGILRDIFAMGARPIAVLDSLRFGSPDSRRAKWIAKGVVKGISDYGNRVGVPTVAGETVFDSAYEGNPLVNVMCVGVVKPKNLTKAVAKGKGNLLVYYGSPTGRDGIHGATFASAELSSEEDKRPNVQIGDPFREKVLLEATLELVEKKLVVGIQDMGAAGITSSSCEMASKGKSGIVIDVSKVPLREENMTPYEIMLSESQERMLAVVEPKKLNKVKKIFEKWEIPWAVIGEVTDSGKAVVKNGDEIVADLPVSLLVDETPEYTRETKIPERIKKAENKTLTFEVADLEKAFMKLISHPSSRIKKWVYEQYDWSVQTNTVIGPARSGGAVLRIKELKGNKGIAVTVDGNGRYMYLNPYRGAYITVAEAVRNLASLGAEPVGLTNCLNFGNPEKPEVYYEIVEGIRGLKEAAEFFEVPVVSGNASLYNEWEGRAVFPTIAVGMVGFVEDLTKVVDSSFKDEGDIIAVIGRTKEEFGGSEILSVLNMRWQGRIPDINPELEKRTSETARDLVKMGILKSITDVSAGGIAVALAEGMVLGNRGAYIEVSSGITPEALLFSESQSRFLITVSPENYNDLKEFVESRGVVLEVIGEVRGDEFDFRGIMRINLEKIKQAMESEI